MIGSVGRATGSLKESHSQMKKINLTCAFSVENVKTYAYYEGSAAHKFGHILGIADGYAGSNNGYQPISANEIKYNGKMGLPEGGEVMIETASVSANDIEMMLCYVLTQKIQYLVSSSIHEISPMIKEEQFYTHTDDKTIYTWDKTIKQFVAV